MNRTRLATLILSGFAAAISIPTGVMGIRNARQFEELRTTYKVLRSEQDSLAFFCGRLDAYNDLARASGGATASISKECARIKAVAMARSI